MTAVGVAGRSSTSLPRHGRVGADGLVEALEPVGLVTWCWSGPCSSTWPPGARRRAGGPERRSVGVVAVAVLVSRAKRWCLCRRRHVGGARSRR